MKLAIVLCCAATLPAAQVDVDCRNDAEDAARLNQAITDSASGDAIRIHGSCLLNATVILRGNRSYIGDSRSGTVLRQSQGANLDALVASDTWNASQTFTGAPARIAHLTIDGNKAENQSGVGLLVRSWLTVIEDVQVRNAPGDGIRITTLGKDGTTRLSNTQVNGRISNCFVTGSGGNGIHVVDPGNSATDWDLLDCWVANSGLSGIRMENAAGWKIRGNHVYGVRQHAIWAHRCFGTTIAENYIETFGEEGGEDKTWYGIACTVQSGAASVISGNKVFRFGARGTGSRFVYIGVPQVNSGTGMLTVTGNAIRGAGMEKDIGLAYELGRGSGLKLLSEGNNVQFTGTPRVIGDGIELVQSQ